MFEDIAGYSGSEDWTRFYSVFYLTKPYTRTAQVEKEIQRAKATSWTPIVVSGTGARRKKEAS